MPLKLSALTADKRTLKVEFAQGALTIAYKPSAVNAVQEAREIEDKATGKVVMSQARTLAETLVSWDLVDDDGKPLPITQETIGGFGIDVSNALYNAILDDLVPNRRRATSSSGGSQAASSAPAQTGT